MPGLEGKTALVTGASRGIGRAIALRLAEDGARIVVNYATSADAAAEVVAAIEAKGGKALAVGCDVADLEALPRMFADLRERVGSLDILINNAGRGGGGLLGTITPGQFDAVFDLNVRATFFVTQGAVAMMNDGGRVISISSISARLHHPGMSIYGASKAAVDGLTRNWAMELASRGITVNSVQAGLVETDLTAGITPEIRALYVSRIAMGRPGRTDDIADVVAFLASDQARWVTGHELVATGGSYS